MDGRGGRGKTRVDREAEQTFGPFGGQKDRAGRDRHPAGSPQWPEGSSGLPLPNSLCTDRGRATNQQEPGWEKTLTGIPLEIFQLWSDYLKPRGYRIKYQIVDFSGGIPGDICIVIAWDD